MLPPEYFTNKEDRLLELYSLELYSLENERKIEMEKMDCYFYDESHQMSATIPSCRYYKKLGYCPCGDCGKYVKKSNADEIIKKYVDKEGK